ncbi:MAG: hypothetical protein L3K26_12440 [Candidatus Hydrogenedentes bacterium]|nr:hypothetical protein [Candidatus Hydrogenedentota bacterium]
MVETLAMQANRSIEFVTGQLAYAERATIPETDPVFGDSSMDYRSCSGAVGRVLLWSPTQSIGVQLEQGELDDGIDNNGNGLIDEGRLVFTQDLGLAAEQQTTKGHWIREYLEGEVPNGIDDNGNGLIDERGLTFQTDGSTVNVQLTLEALDPSGRLITKTVRSTIRIRN